MECESGRAATLPGCINDVELVPLHLDSHVTGGELSVRQMCDNEPESGPYTR